MTVRRNLHKLNSSLIVLFTDRLSSPPHASAYIYTYDIWYTCFPWVVVNCTPFEEHYIYWAPKWHKNICHYTRYWANIPCYLNGNPLAYMNVCIRTTQGIYCTLVEAYGKPFRAYCFEKQRMSMAFRYISLETLFVAKLTLFLIWKTANLFSNCDINGFPMNYLK